jgi:drug/metabolite transporter (DMT)-like permease
MSVSRARLGVAFAAVYVIWGSTYLGIRVAIETMPPFVMAGTRFLMAGAVLYAFARWRGIPAPTGLQWRTAALVGALLLLGGNGGVVWAEQRVASGLTAVLVATEPLMIVVLDWLRPGGERPGGAVVAGLLIGLAGMVFLIAPWETTGSGAVDPLGASAVVFAALVWAIGSLYTARGAPLPSSPVLATGAEMLAGGLLLLGAGTVTGEWGDLNLAAISARSWIAFAYLVIFGAIVGFSAYTYMLRNASPSSVSTYAYVNPVVAMLLGWSIANEPITARTLMAAAVILGSVVVITTAKAKNRRSQTESEK